MRVSRARGPLAVVATIALVGAAATSAAAAPSGKSKTTVEADLNKDVVATCVQTDDYTHAWSITKSIAGDDSATLLPGASTTFRYLVSAVRDDGAARTTYGDCAVSGTITVKSNVVADDLAALLDVAPYASTTAGFKDRIDATSVVVEPAASASPAQDAKSVTFRYRIPVPANTDASALPADLTRLKITANVRMKDGGPSNNPSWAGAASTEEPLPFGVGGVVEVNATAAVHDVLTADDGLAVAAGTGAPVGEQVAATTTWQYDVDVTATATRPAVGEIDALLAVRNTATLTLADGTVAGTASATATITIPALTCPEGTTQEGSECIAPPAPECGLGSDCYFGSGSLKPWVNNKVVTQESRAFTVVAINPSLVPVTLCDNGGKDPRCLAITEQTTVGDVLDAMTELNLSQDAPVLKAIARFLDETN